MSIEQEIRHQATKVPYAEIVQPSKGQLWAHVNLFEGMNGANKSDVLKALGTVCYPYCGGIDQPAICLYDIPVEIGKILKNTDSVIIGHGPLSERSGGVPSVGIDANYQGWMGHRDNDSELTIVSSSDRLTIQNAILEGVTTAKIKDLSKSKRNVAWTKIKNTAWQTPSWNMGSNKINEFIQTNYTFFGKTTFPAYDIHYVNGNNAIVDFLTIYGNRYSNVFGSRFLVCFIKPDGSLEQKIWQPIKPEIAPKNHFISFQKLEILDMAWIIPETIKLVLDTVRYSSVVKREAIINPAQSPDITESLYKWTDVVREEKGNDWLRQKATKKFSTALHRSELFGEDKKEKLISELQKVDWFKVTGVKI